MLFAAPAAIAVPIIAGFLLGGPLLGFAFAVLAAVVIVAVAIPRGPRAGVEGDPEEGRRVRRAAAERFAVPLVLGAAGIVTVAVSSGAIRIIGWGVFAIAITVAISLMFLEVGLSEDRDRARDRDRGFGGRGPMAGPGG